jgi:hypothetical protein
MMMAEFCSRFSIAVKEVLLHFEVGYAMRVEAFTATNTIKSPLAVSHVILELISKVSEAETDSEMLDID